MTNKDRLELASIAFGSNEATGEPTALATFAVTTAHAAPGLPNVQDFTVSVLVQGKRRPNEVALRAEEAVRHLMLRLAE